MMKYLLRLVFLASLLVSASNAAMAQGFSSDRQADYLLGPGDVVRIQVFQNADLTVEARVSESGVISYPLLGVIKIGG